MSCTADKSVALGYAAQDSGLYGTVLEARAMKTRTGPIPARRTALAVVAVSERSGGWVGG